MRAALNLLEGGLTCDYEDITECPTYQSLVAGRMACTHRERSRSGTGEGPRGSPPG